MSGDAAAARSFYGRWADLYDLVATRTPGVEGWRERAADALELAPGDTVVEMGCGTGANLPYLRERVGATGGVVGVDFTAGVLALARERAARWDNVAVVRGDATRPPVTGPVDAVLGSFVVGMLADPSDAVGDWFDLLAPDGRIALLDAASSPERYAAPLNIAFRAFVRLGAPGGGAGTEPAVRSLDRRVAAGHGAVTDRGADARTERHALGFVLVTSGRRP